MMVRAIVQDAVGRAPVAYLMTKDHIYRTKDASLRTRIMLVSIAYPPRVARSTNPMAEIGHNAITCPCSPRARHDPHGLEVGSRECEHC